MAYAPSREELVGDPIDSRSELGFLFGDMLFGTFLLVSCGRYQVEYYLSARYLNIRCLERVPPALPYSTSELGSPDQASSDCLDFSA